MRKFFKLFRFSPRRCLAIMKKEIFHTLRDVNSLGLIIVMPVVMIILFGYAVSGDIKNVPMAVLDLNRIEVAADNTDPEKVPTDRDQKTAQELIDAFDNSEFFNVKYIVKTQEELEGLIKSGKVNVGVVIPLRYNLRFENQGSSLTVPLVGRDRVHVYVDGADPAVARIASEACGKLISNFSTNKIDQLMSSSGQFNTFNPSAYERGAIYQTVIENELMRQKQFLIPSIISLIVFSIIIVLTASTIVREKERGTIEQLMITPMTKSEFMLGKLIPYVAVGFVDILMILFMAWFLFSITSTGSIFLFIMLGMLFVLCALGLGILISTFCSNQGQAVILAVAVIVPSLILCGIISPVSTMPTVVQWIANLLPLTHFLEISRQVIIKGNDIAYMIPQVTALAVFAISVMLISIFKFKKSLD